MPDPMSPQPITATRWMTAGTSAPAAGRSARSTSVLPFVPPAVAPLFDALLAMDILPWCVGDGWVVGTPRGRRPDPLAGPLCHPSGPVLPPRALLPRRSGPPFLGVVKELVVRPVLPFRVGRVDDPGNVARSRQDVAAFAAGQPGRGVRRGPGWQGFLN